MDIGGGLQKMRLYPPKTDAEFDSLIPIKDWAVKYSYSMSGAYGLIRRGAIGGYRYSRRWYLYDKPPRKS
jgi:hypothetical protein